MMLDTRSRFVIEPRWPNGGMVTRPMGDTAYVVQQYTGYPVGKADNSHWVRGQIVRGDTPTLRPRREPIQYDPTDPRTWPMDRGGVR